MHQMTLTLAKITKGTVRYDYDGPRHEVAVPAVYVQKEFLPADNYPPQIDVTITYRQAS